MNPPGTEALNRQALEVTSEAEIGLVAQAQRGDREAFNEIVRRHRQGVINVVYRMCGDASLAEDAAQAAFLKAWQHLAGYRPRAPFRSWLYRIAVNAALDLLRQDRPTLEIEHVQVASPDRDLEEQAEQRERGEMVRKAVLSLPPASRAVLVLREYERLSYEEIAEALDIPAGTVMSRLSYARTKLCEMLKPLLEAA